MSRFSPAGLSGSTSLIAVSLAAHVALFAAAGLRDAPAETSIPSMASTTMPVELEDVVPREPPEDAPVMNNVVAAPAHAMTPPPAHETPVVRAAAAPPTQAPTVAAPPAAPTDDGIPRFKLGPASGAQTFAVAGGGAAPPGDDAAEDTTTYAQAAVDVPARAIAPSRPRYPLEAQSAGLEATVELAIVLTKTGAIADVHALSHPGHGFEEEALAFARRTRFSPASKRGRPVAVQMQWTVRFELR
jgi:protein TonB